MSVFHARDVDPELDKKLLDEYFLKPGVFDKNGTRKKTLYKRKCLGIRCNKTFMAESKFIRICPKCSVHSIYLEGE